MQRLQAICHESTLSLDLLMPHLLMLRVAHACLLIWVDGLVCMASGGLLWRVLLRGLLLVIRIVLSRRKRHDQQVSTLPGARCPIAPLET